MDKTLEQEFVQYLHTLNLSDDALAESITLITFTIAYKNYVEIYEVFTDLEIEKIEAIEDKSLQREVIAISFHKKTGKTIQDHSDQNTEALYRLVLDLSKRPEDMKALARTLEDFRLQSNLTGVS